MTIATKDITTEELFLAPFYTPKTPLDYYIQIFGHISGLGDIVLAYIGKDLEMMAKLVLLTDAWAKEDPIATQMEFQPLAKACDSLMKEHEVHEATWEMTTKDDVLTALKLTFPSGAYVHAWKTSSQCFEFEFMGAGIKTCCFAAALYQSSMHLKCHLLMTPGLFSQAETLLGHSGWFATSVQFFPARGGLISKAAFEVPGLDTQLLNSGVMDWVLDGEAMDWGNWAGVTWEMFAKNHQPLVNMSLVMAILKNQVEST